MTQSTQPEPLPEPPSCTPASTSAAALVMPAKPKESAVPKVPLKPTVPSTPKAPPTPDQPDIPFLPKHPEEPGINPDIDPDLPEKPGPPLSDPDAPHG